MAISISKAIKIGSYDYTVSALIPFSPLLPGFVIDTLFYAAIWFGVFFGFASAKRAIRRKRGRCPMCGYDLRGALLTLRIAGVIGVDQHIRVNGVHASLLW